MPAAAVGTEAMRGSGPARAGTGPQPPVEVIEQALVDLLRLMSSRRLHEARTAETGLRISRTQLHFLSLLDERGPSSVSALAGSAGISQPAASRAVAQLAEDGLVRRSGDLADRRRMQVAITPAGRKARERLRRLMRAQLGHVLSPMSPGRQAELGALLAELVERLRDPEAERAAELRPTRKGPRR